MPASGTPPHQPHDKGYKYLFHSKRAFLEFLRAFIPRDWVYQIGEDHLYRPETTYILPDFRDKEADIVYELRRSTQDGQPEIIFYETKAAARKDFRLPPIVPIVLYNGKAPWTAAQTFRHMLKGEHLFGDELLNFRYMLIDVHRMEEHTLLQLSNLMGAVFYLDQSDSLTAILQRLQTLLDTIQRLLPEQQQLFFTWVARILSARLPTEEQQTVEELVKAIKEKGVSDMQTNIERILDEALHHKLKEGLEKGREEGRVEGTRAVARKLLLKGMDIPFIVEMTELSEEEIERIKRELPKQ